MGNSEILAQWDTLSTSLVRPTSIDPEEREQYTSLSSFRTFTLIKVLDPLHDYYEAEDDAQAVWGLHLYRIEDFDVVRELRRKIDFLRADHLQLLTFPIIDVIEQPRSDGTWILAVVSPLLPTLTLEQWLETGYEDRFFSPDDIVEGLICILEALDHAHKRDQWAGQILPKNIILTKEEGGVKLKLDWLHTECFEDFRESRNSLIHPPEGIHHTRSRDIWDLCVTLLTVLEGAVPCYEITVSSMQTSNHPEVFRHLLSLMCRPEDQRPSPESLLSDPSLEFFRSHLQSPLSLPSIKHVPALCLGLSMRSPLTKTLCLRLLLDLYLRFNEAEIVNGPLEIDISHIISTALTFDFTSQIHLIPPLFRLCLQQLQRNYPPLYLKQVGVIELVRKCLVHCKAQMHPREFLKEIIAFAGMCDLNTGICAVYDEKVVNYRGGEETDEEFVVSTCYKAGKRATDVIIKAYKEARWIDRSQAVKLLQKVPLHYFCHRDFSEMSDLEYLLKETIQEPMHNEEKVSYVTKFLAHILQGFRLRSYCASQGLCFSCQPLGIMDEVLECESGYYCGRCDVHVCQTCLMLHIDHQPVYAGRVTCQQSPKQQLAPLFRSFTGLKSREGDGNETVIGPAERDFTISLPPSEGDTESLGFYKELYLSKGGNRDDFHLSIGPVHYSGQSGLISTSTTLCPAPFLSQGDVLGLGITSTSRLFLTFNGIPHPFFTQLSAFPSSFTVSIDSQGVVKVKNSHFLFDATVVNVEPEEIRGNVSGKKFSHSFWTQYSDSVSHSPSSQKKLASQLARAADLQNKERMKKDSVEMKRCKYCGLF